MIKFLFKDRFIPTYDKGETINNKFIHRWYPNSPDLSAIEIILWIIKQMMILFPPKTMSGLKRIIKINSKKYLRKYNRKYKISMGNMQ